MHFFIRDRILKCWARNAIPISSRTDLTRLGTDYGGWIIPATMLNKSSVCWCAGVGEDASFDLALIKTFGCHVYAVDPTPRAQSYVSSLSNLSSSYHFLPVGLWTEDATVRFYQPKNPKHVSHSAVNLQGTTAYILAKCRSLASLMFEFGHSRIDLLKMDIEGAEHAVIGGLLNAAIFPAVLAVEFDQPTPWKKVRRTIQRLLDAGYELVAIDRWNYTFVHKPMSMAAGL